MEAAEALNEAYADALPLDGLLRQHRLLALAHASLAHRLRLMRKISALDTKSAVWAEDIQAFEKARFAQIDKEAKQAIAGNNVVQVAALADELGRTKWLAAPPGSLKSYVESAASRFHQKKLRERLENLEQKLNEAHSALDVERGRTLRAQWQELCREIDLPIEDSLRDRVFPALGWLQKEDRKEATAQKQQAQCAELESALNDSAPSEVLESRYAAVKALDRD